MAYSLDQHGDYLEREMAIWIRHNIPYYESIWSIFIGHRGNGLMAEMPYYPNPDSRVKFAEHSYTVLQSAVIIDTIIKSEVFNQPHKSLNSVIDFHKNFITFYALIGRIKDCLVKLASPFMNTKKIEEELKVFYNQRNIVLHGKSIPLIQDEIGLIRIPNLNFWDDKTTKWSDVQDVNQLFVSENNEDVFADLMKLVNDVYAQLFQIINDELKTLSIKLEVPKLCSWNMAVSGSFIEISKK